MNKPKTAAAFTLLLAGIFFANGTFGIDNKPRKEDLRHAIIAYNNGQFLKAVREYKQLADTQDVTGYLNLAVIFKDLGHYERAIKILERAHLKFKDDLRILYLLGRLYYLNHQIDQAIDILKRILEINPEDSETNINLGLCYAEKGDDIAAQNYHQRALSINSSSVIAHLSLASLYYRQEKIQEAVAEFKQISLIDASIVNVQKILGELLFKLGNLEESLKIYRKILLREPQNKLIQVKISEITDKLGKEYFEKERQRLALLKKQKKVLIKTSPAIKGVTSVRVGLMQQEDSFEFRCSSPFEIKTKSGQVEVFSGLEDEVYLVSRSVDNKIFITNPKQENIIIDEPILIKPRKAEGTVTIFNVTLGKNNFWMNQSDRSYRGTIEINVDKNGLTVINIVNLEEYLYSVLPSEMPANWPKEALKAQGIAARSEAIKKLGRHKDDGFDFCAQVHCQAYSGVEQETEATNKAVDETRGLIMVYKNEPVDALYSSNCAGHTQDNIFGNSEEIPYLKGRPDVLDEKGLNFPLSPLEFEDWLKQPPQGILCDTAEYSRNSSFRWVRLYSYDEIKEMLDKIADFGQIQKIIVTKRNKSGHVTQVKIIGSNTTYILEKELNIRSTLGNLRSSMFKVEVKKDYDASPQQFIFYGGGWGHGVGMCQSGAYGLANLGKDYKEILNHYFSGIEFKKVY